mgnify:CR=1 FL=1
MATTANTARYHNQIRSFHNHHRNISFHQNVPLRQPLLVSGGSSAAVIRRCFYSRSPLLSSESLLQQRKGSTFSFITTTRLPDSIVNHSKFNSLIGHCFVRQFSSTTNNANQSQSKMALPRVFFDIAADNQPLGRIVIEVCFTFCHLFRFFFCFHKLTWIPYINLSPIHVNLFFNVKSCIPNSFELFWLLFTKLIFFLEDCFSKMKKL